MKELVEVIAKALVDDPESVVVNEREEKKTTVLEVRVAESDMGNRSWLLPSDQIRRDSVVIPKDFSTDTITVAMIPEENPTL